MIEEQIQAEQVGELSERVLEECAELIHAICKARRFGWQNYHPSGVKTNLSQVREEIDDVITACAELDECLLGP